MESFRRLIKGPAGIALVTLFCLPFVLIGFQSYFTGQSNSSGVAQVNGETISVSEYQNTLRARQDYLSQQMGGQVDESLLNSDLMKESVLDSLIQQQVLQQAAAKEGLTLSKEALYKLITEIPQFQENGKFSEELYRRVLFQSGITLNAFPEKLKQDFIAAQQRNSLVASAFVTDAEAKYAASLSQQSRDIQYIILKAVDYKAEVELTDELIDGYYQEHLADFQTTEKFKVAYVELEKSQFTDQVDVTDEDLQVAYELRVAEASAQEQRSIAHIMISTQELDEAQARVRAQEVQDKLAAGEQFADLAATYSDDLATAEEGGELGVFEPGVFPESFDTVVYELQVGEVSDVVVTNDGLHLIKLESVTQEEVPDFDVIKEELVAEVTEAQLDELYADSLEQFEDESLDASTIEAAAQSMGLDVQMTALQPLYTLPEPLNQPLVLEVIQSEELLEEGDLSEVVVVGDTALLLSVAQHELPHPKPLSEVKAQIEYRYTQEQAEELAAQEGEQLLALDTDALNQAVKEAGLSFDVQEGIKRQNTEVNPMIVKHAFAMTKPVVAEGDEQTTVPSSGLELASGDYVLVQLLAVHTGDENPAELLIQKQSLSRSIGQQEFLSYTAYLESQADIKRFRNNL